MDHNLAENPAAATDWAGIDLAPLPAHAAIADEGDGGMFLAAGADTVIAVFDAIDFVGEFVDQHIRELEHEEEARVHEAILTGRDDLATALAAKLEGVKSTKDPNDVFTGAASRELPTFVTDALPTAPTARPTRSRERKADGGQQPKRSERTPRLSHYVGMKDVMDALDCSKSTAYRHLREASGRVNGTGKSLRVLVEVWERYAKRTFDQ